MIVQPMRSRAIAAWLPTLPNPWITTRAPAMSHSPARACSPMTKATPSPVASTRPSVPPSATGLPVTIAGACSRERPHQSIIHAISRGPDPMSGAMMSVIGPIACSSGPMSPRVIACISVSDNDLGSQSTPPLAPPKGRSLRAVFQVIVAASARAPSRSISGWYRIPPL